MVVAFHRTAREERMHDPPVSPVVCPFCLHQSAFLSGRGARCGACGTHLVVSGRFVLRRIIAKDRGHDVVDGVGLLAKGLDLERGEPVLVRIAGTERSLFEREIAVLRGLAGRRDLPTVRAHEPGVPHVCVMSWPQGHTVDALLDAGYRVTEAQVAVVVRRLLATLAELGALSPSVHHRALHPGNVFIADGGRVQLMDFARATDTRADDDGVVAARPGYALPAGRARSPAAEDLYAVGVLAAQLLTRVPADQLPIGKSGAPDLGAITDVSSPVGRVLDRLLASGTRAGFTSAAEALRALDPVPSRVLPVLYAAAAAFFALVTAATAGAVGYLLWRTQPTPAPLPPLVVQAAPPAEVRAELRVETTPSGAELWIDGVPSGTTPLSMVLPPGGHRVEARLARYRTAVQTVELDARGHTVLLALAPAAIAKPAPRPDDDVRRMPRIMPLPAPTAEELEAARERARLYELGNELARRIAAQTALGACRPPSDACGDATVHAVTLEVAVEGAKVIVADIGAASGGAPCAERVIEARVAPPEGADGLRGTVRVVLAPAVSASGWGWRR